MKDRFIDRFSAFHFLEDEEEEIALFNGRLDAAKCEEILPTLIAPESIDAFFICGPGPMMDAVEQALLARDVAKSKILIERFTTRRALRRAGRRRARAGGEGRRVEDERDAERPARAGHFRSGEALDPRQCPRGGLARAVRLQGRGLRHLPRQGDWPGK